MNMRGFLYAKEIMKKCTKVKGSIQEGEQKAHKNSTFGRSALCTGNYDLYALGVSTTHTTGMGAFGGPATYL